MFFKESVCVYIQSRYPVLQKHLRIQCGIFLNGNLKQENTTLVEENVIFTWRRAFQFKNDNRLCARPDLRWRHAKDVAPALQGPLISTLTPGTAMPPEKHTHLRVLTPVLCSHWAVLTSPYTSPIGSLQVNRFVLWLLLLQMSAIQATFVKFPQSTRVNVRALEK